MKERQQQTVIIVTSNPERGESLKQQIKMVGEYTPVVYASAEDAFKAIGTAVEFRLTQPPQTLPSVIKGIVLDLPNCGDMDRVIMRDKLLTLPKAFPDVKIVVAGDSIQDADQFKGVTTFSLERLDRLNTEITAVFNPRTQHATRAGSGVTGGRGGVR